MSRKLLLDSSDVQRFALMMVDEETRVENKIILKKDSCYPWLIEDKHSEDPEWMKSQNIGCAAGITTLFITSHGDVVPCPFLCQLVIGDIRHNSFEEIWESQALNIFRTLTPNDLKGKCRNCKHLGRNCYGGCRAAALAHCGDFYGEDPFCWKDG